MANSHSLIFCAFIFFYGINFFIIMLPNLKYFLNKFFG